MPLFAGAMCPELKAPGVYRTGGRVPAALLALVSVPWIAARALRWLTLKVRGVKCGVFLFDPLMKGCSLFLHCRTERFSGVSPSARLGVLLVRWYSILR